jgi:hypothetical protein
MPIRVKCEKCKKTLSVKDHLAGKRIKCPLCQGVVAVPLASPTKEAPGVAKESADPAKNPAPKPAAETTVRKSTTAKTIPKSKPAPGKPETNGTHSTNGDKTNGKAHAPAPLDEPPPENVEEEALAALADEPPPPPVEDEGPQTIDFKCQWCDEDVKLPIELAGKQAQCPNPECKRIVKVPLPKKEEKKDWRKMDRKGPAGAIINQPEALENAWGTEEANKARADSLAQAGIGVPQKPPRGILGWLKIGVIAIAILAAITGVSFFGYKRFTTNREEVKIDDVKQLAAKIEYPTLRGEAFRTIVLYHLRGLQPKPGQVHKDFSAGVEPIKTDAFNDDAPHLNEQFFLIDLALARSEVNPEANGAIDIEKKEKEWDEARKNAKSALDKISSPQLRVVALRRLGYLLKNKNKPEIAIGLAGGFSATPAGKKLPAFRQQIALVFWENKLDKLPEVKEPNLADLKELDESKGDLRVGFAEGYARKDSYDQAFKIANFPGPEFDRLEANLGIAEVALQDQKKDQAATAFKTALELAKNPNIFPAPTPWHWFALARIAIRLEDPAAPEIVNALPPPFKMRAQLEMVYAQCDKATTPLEANVLNDLETATTKDRVTLALGWTALARQNARVGGSGDRKRLEKALDLSSLSPEDKTMIRPMIEIGWFQGLLK